jgi:ABC-type histidine transport system ATPase subunit
MLEVEQMHTFYGLSHILFGVSFSIESGKVVCLQEHHVEEHHRDHAAEERVDQV